MATTFVSSETGISFVDLDSALAYAGESGEYVNEIAEVPVARATADFSALSFTTETRRVATYDASGFQI